MSRAVSFLVFVVLLAGSVALSQRDFEFLLEPDFNPSLILAFENLLKTWSWAAVPIPGPHVYLDAQDFIYGAAVLGLRQVVQLPSDLRYCIVAATALNALSYATGCWLFWRLVLTVTEKMWLGSQPTHRKIIKCAEYQSLSLERS